VPADLHAAGLDNNVAGADREELEEAGCSEVPMMMILAGKEALGDTLGKDISAYEGEIGHC
jgi:hypothetical protein